jgi:hypothetical protein
MKKTIKRILAGTLLTVIVTISGLATIIFFPQPLFANKMEYKQFKIYSNSEISKGIEIVLDNALGLVKKSELNDPTYTYDVFLCYKSIFNKIDDKLLGYGPTARATDNNVVVKVNVDPTRNLAFPTFRGNCEADLTYLVAHEMMHCLQENKYGKLRFNPFHHPAFWKLEGYPEYISRQTKLTSQGYDLKKEIDRYIDLESKLTDIWISIEDGRCTAPKLYYKSRLMMEYLIDVKNLSYDKILNDTVSENEIYAEMLKWKTKEQISIKF